MKKLFIAIDGPSASGKGTIAKKLAEHLGLPVLYTGNLYRAVAFEGLYHNIKPDNIDEIIRFIKTISLQKLENPNLREERIGEYASIIASFQEIRKALYNFQRNFIESSNGTVIEGRDIGTVICPEAQVKFFLTASVEVRAQRRFAQQDKESYETILADLKRRDERDQNRSAAPLKMAQEAIMIDNSNLSIQATLELMLDKIKTLS